MLTAFQAALPVKSQCECGGRAAAALRERVRAGIQPLAARRVYCVRHWASGPSAVASRRRPATSPASCSSCSQGARPRVSFSVWTVTVWSHCGARRRGSSGSENDPQEWAARARLVGTRKSAGQSGSTPAPPSNPAPSPSFSISKVGSTLKIWSRPMQATHLT